MASGTIPFDPNRLLYCKTFSLNSTQTEIRIPSTDSGIYLIVMYHRSSGDRYPYVAAVCNYSTSNVNIKQLTSNNNNLTVEYTSTGGTITGFKVTTPGMMSGFVLSSYDFPLTLN